MEDGIKVIPEKILEKKITLSVQQLIAYGAFLITIGASIYTFFQALPKIDKLEESVTKLEVSNAHFEQRIIDLKESWEDRKKIQETRKP